MDAPDFDGWFVEKAKDGQSIAVGVEGIVMGRYYSGTSLQVRA